MAEEQKSTWRPKFKSEFSMGDRDFDRYHEALKKADESGGILDSCAVPQLEDVQKHFANLNALYKNWSALISSDHVRKEVKGLVEDARKQKRRWEQSNLELTKPLKLKLVDTLDRLHLKLLDIKQVVGLGIVVKKVISTNQKIKNGLKPKIDFTNLPEV